MMGDVAPRADLRIGAQAMGEPVDRFPRPLGARGVAERRRIGHEELEERDRIGARPLIVRPGLVPADRARGGDPDQRAPALQVDDRDRPLPAPAEAPERTVGKRRIDPPRGEAGVDPVEHLVESAGKEAREKAASGREAAVRPDQMFAPLQHGPSQSSRGSFSTCQVWPRETSAWRSAGLPAAISAFWPRIALSKVGRGSS